MTKSQTCHPSPESSSPSPSSSSKVRIIETNSSSSSHMISNKIKPKIRIIHLYAPEIIKTDAANFRELVQRLTGKPEDELEDGGGGNWKMMKKKRKTPQAKLDDPLMGFEAKKRIIMCEEEEEEEELVDLQNEMRMMIKNEHDEYVNDDDNDDMWGRSSRPNHKFNGGFFDGFSELDGFMEELSTMPVV